MTTANETPAPAPRSKPSPKKGFNPMYFVALGTFVLVVALVWLTFWVIGEIQSSFVQKPVSTQVVASNATSTTPPAQPPVVPSSKATTPTPATGEGSTAKVDVKAEGGKLRVDFDPCCNCKPTSTPPKASKKGHHKQAHKPAPVATAPAETTPTPKNASFWGWVHPNSSDSNPMRCYADREINGKPKRCTEMITKPAEAGDTEDAWRTRMAALAGIKVGVKTDKGTITGVRNADVQVK
jgi:cytoskeletal protein RodZ